MDCDGGDGIDVEKYRISVEGVKRISFAYYIMISLSLSTMRVWIQLQMRNSRSINSLSQLTESICVYMIDDIYSNITKKMKIFSKSLSLSLYTMCVWIERKT